MTTPPSWPFALGMFQAGSEPPFLGVVDPHLRLLPFQELFEGAAWPTHLPQPLSLFALLQDWPACWSELQAGAPDRLAAATGRMQPMANFKAMAPVPEARQLICTGANYRKHVIDLVAAQGAGAASEGMSVQERRDDAAQRVDERARNGIPYAFPKLVSSITGPQDDITVPADAQQFDWELELGVVMGRPCWRTPVERAMDCVAGYTVVNDLTRRELVYRPDLKSLGSDWLRAKSGPGFFPMGPLFVPAAFIEPGNLRLRLQVNGHTMQDESTSDMLWDVPRQIAYISAYARLLPGDVIATGSPAGNGMHHGRFLQPGDVMTGEIEQLGRQVHRIVKEEVV